MKKFDTEIIVGIFIVCGLICLAYISINLGKINLLGNDYYMVQAVFPTVSGLKKDTVVEIAGVEVGKVYNIELKDYEAVVTLQIRHDIALYKDAIASIRTKGLLGEKYMKIDPGGSDELIEPGGKIWEVEKPIDIEELIGQFIFGKVK